MTGQQVTYGQLETMVAQVATGLVKHRLVSTGTVVTLFSTNCIEYAVTYLAVTSVGGIINLVNNTYTVSK